MAFPRRKRKPARALFASLLIIVFYFLLFPYPLGREKVAIPRWAVTIPSDSGSSSSTPDAQGAAAQAPGAGLTTAPFHLGERFGFVTGSGDIRYAGKRLYRVALSATGFVNYTRLGTDWILQDETGRRAASFSVSGYPLLSPNGSRVFSVKTDLSGIVELDRGGGVLWDRDFPTIITAVSVQGDLLLVGLLNGSLLLLNRQGSPVFENSPGGSRLPVVVGDALAPDGSLMAAVAGIDPQSLIVLARRGAGFAAQARVALPSTFRREIRMGFSPDSRWLFLEGGTGPGLVDPSRGTVRWIGLPGVLAGAAFTAQGRMAAFVSRDQDKAMLAIEPMIGVPVARESFPARELTLAAIEGGILMGWDGRLLRIDLGDM